MAVEHDGASPFYLSYFEGWQQHFVPFGLGAMQLGRALGIGPGAGVGKIGILRGLIGQRGVTKPPESDATMK